MVLLDTGSYLGGPLLLMTWRMDSAGQENRHRSVEAQLVEGRWVVSQSKLVVGREVHFLVACLDNQSFVAAPLIVPELVLKTSKSELDQEVIG